MTLWMLWSTLFAAIVGVAALAIERAASGFGAPRRHVWMTALVVASVVPALLAVRRLEITRVLPAPAAVKEAVGATANAPTLTTGVPVAVVNETPAADVPSVPATITLDEVMFFAWLAATCAMASLFIRGLAHLRRKRREWIDATVRRSSVLLSADEGPAVIGFTRPSIVFPKWALTLDADMQELILRHEAEHIRTGDPRTLLIAGLFLVVLPWNAALWWIVRRLCLAMELDCDARVIRSVGRSHEYGLMLLAVGEQRLSKLPLASAFASTRPLLERRIDAMTLPRPRRPLRAALPFFAVALLASVAATNAPRPASLRDPLITVEYAQTERRSVPVVQPSVVPTQSVQTRREPPRVVTSIRPVITDSAPATIEIAPAIVVPDTNPDRAKVAALATEQLRSVVMGDTKAEYIVMVLDANGRHVWSTHGNGNLRLEVGADPRTPIERREYTRMHRAELVGTAGGAVVGGIVLPELIIADGLVRRRARMDSTVIITDTGVVRMAARGAGGGGGGGRGGRGGGGGSARSGGGAGADSIAIDQIRLKLDSMMIRIRPESLKFNRVDVAGAGARSGGGGGGGGGGAVGGGGRGGRGGGGGLGVATADTVVGPYGVGWAGSRVPGMNQATGLEEGGNGKSGIAGLPSSSVTAADTYTFAPGELAPTLLRIVVVSLSEGANFRK